MKIHVDNCSLNICALAKKASMERMVKQKTYVILLGFAG